ncbi:uncharacterized protein C8A04DRAFT_14760 [Dichotomopilus funicola]|uniref:F-box domain-containing protein n=1 Tax=Dichotomopilus funicola TaxID=1934379 RepID=A0AAN6UWQ6_9PEZI|nr:hypothetical protein C8A04DRAFT_14760 [Dichotomopilus funicola]
MQSGLIELPSHDLTTTDDQSSQTTTAQHGPGRFRSGSPGAGPLLSAPGASADEQRLSPISAAAGSPDDDFNVGQVDHSFGRLSVVTEGQFLALTRATVAGQRIFDYENAAISSPVGNNNAHPGPGFKVSPNPKFSSVYLTDLPNEILTQILSHLHPDSHGAVALVSKRFYALVTTPYAWRAAFLRYFTGENSVVGHAKNDQRAKEAESSDAIRSEARYFTRLTALASWRSEYLIRTRLLRSVVRGKPGGRGSAAARPSQSGKKATAVLTFNSKLPWMISHVHADFTGGKKGPRVIHGTRDLGVATASDPTTGKIEKWGLDDPFLFQQLDEVFPNLDFYGAGDGPAAVPNVMDVSQVFGVVGGEGFPGGRVYYKATGQLRGHYIGNHAGDGLNPAPSPPEIPKILALVDATSCVWIAKSSGVTSTTQSMVGIMAGSTLGVVTSYSLGHESTGPRFSDGDMTARWALSPGVPIIDLKVDEQYSLRRKSLGRVWAVALNALGEVFYLTEPPSPPTRKGKAEDAVTDAWHTGRTAHWELIEMTRRTAKSDEFNDNAVMGTYSPRSSSHAMNLSREQVTAEAREIEQYFRHTPAHFKRVCQGWDMLRKLEVDFAAGGEGGGGAIIVLITSGSEEGQPSSVRRYIRTESAAKSTPSGVLTPVAPSTAPRPSIFGGENAIVEAEISQSADVMAHGASPLLSGESTPRLGSAPAQEETEEWRVSELVFKHAPTTEITATALDMSNNALMAVFEDPLLSGLPGSNPPATPTSKHATTEIPGRRARLLAIGTNNGSVVVWNLRDNATTSVNPVRVIHTDSPEITALAVSALYLLHGGSDSLVQAWDPLASSLEPIRTLNAKSSGRIPRHILQTNPALQHSNYFAVRAIALDPDATILRGVLAFGTFIRSWSYSSRPQGPGRKRRLKHSDIHGRLASRRNNSTVSSYIAAEEAELRHEQEHRSREVARLRKRFGVGLAGLTEEEALQYAQMISEESFAADEVRRGTTSASDTAADMASSAGSEFSLASSGRDGGLNGLAGPSGTAGLPVLAEEAADRIVSGGHDDGGTGGEEDDYEAQIQRAIRLSLLESSERSSSPPAQTPSPPQSWTADDSSPCEYEIKFQVKSGKGRGKGKSKGKGQSVNNTTSPRTATSTGIFSAATASGAAGSGSATSYGATSNPAGLDVGVDADDDLELALRLSMQEEEARQRKMNGQGADMGWYGDLQEYPPLEGKGKGKGKWV